MKRLLFFLIFPLLLIRCTSVHIHEPKPFGALPSERQLRWHETEFYGLIHYTPTTFEGKEWGYGDADPAVFNPTKFDAGQIVGAARQAGMKGIILVAKHHDGFCLWPSATTDYNISRSPWKNGQGDMVMEFRKACDSLGMKFGVYVSPWDRNNPYYGSPEYVKIYREQLREIYSGYGTLFMSWHDGANGGDGFYGGAKEHRQIDRSIYYGWDSLWAMTRRMQPNACIFSDAGPDVRWIGNENGLAGETCWATYSPQGNLYSERPVPGDTRYLEGVEGHRDGKYWMPGECDVPFRPGWFYHAEQDSLVKTVEMLKTIYLSSVGHGQSLDLGLSPDKNGLLHQNDVAVLQNFGRWLQETFSINLAKQAEMNVSNVRQAQPAFGLQNLTDDDLSTYWATDDGVCQAELRLQWKQPVTFRYIRLREYIPLGQRIDSVAFDIYENNDWRPVAQATSIGAQRIIQLPELVSTTQFRIRILPSAAEPCLSEIGIYAGD
ncbi:MAG: alpha-L-fucosidase [Bacteroidales bacterium]|nr:alpha-L-fucosidase [Bacteroidales bacterium]